MEINRRLGLVVALGHFLSSDITPEDYEDASEEELQEMIDDGKLSFWQPFEYWSLDDVLSQIEALSDTVVRVLQAKEESYIKQKG